LDIPDLNGEGDGIGNGVEGLYEDYDCNLQNYLLWMDYCFVTRIEFQFENMMKLLVYCFVIRKELLFRN